MKSVDAIILAAGRGSRMQLEQNKVFLRLNGRSVLEHSVRAFHSCPQISGLIVVGAAHELDTIRTLLADYPVKVVCGGEERRDSVLKGLEASTADIVAIHDAARPFVTHEVITRSIASAMEKGSGVAGVPLKDTVKTVNTDFAVVNTPPRAQMLSVQTPQTFQRALIYEAYTSVPDRDVTDDAGVLERFGHPVYMTAGDNRNIKITTREDLLIGKAFMEEETMNFRVGSGYDVHRLVEGRKLILGGVHIPYELGLEGHSDADVLLHAITDALFGAAGMGDIGQHFPDTSAEFKDIDSMILLRRAYDALREAGYRVGNIDATVIAQRPKLAAFIPQMQANIARTLELSPSEVNVKATTTEKLGFTGRGEGIAAESVCLLMKE